MNPVLWGQIAETLCEYGGGSSSDDSMDEPLPNSDDSMDELSQNSDETSTSTAQPRKRANDMQATCHVCGRTFASYKRLMGHHQANHLVMALQCEECGRRFSSSKLLTHHRLMCSIREEEPPAKKPKRDSQVGRGHRAALQNNAAVETFIPTAVQDILGALREIEPTIITYLKEKLEDDDLK